MGSYTWEALTQGWAHLNREVTKTGIQTSLIINQPGKGFCETCQKHKPAPKGRNKGWTCRDCRQQAKAKTSSTERDSHGTYVT